MSRRKWPPRAVVRPSQGLRALESALQRSGLGPVAGVDEAGRGACAGPLVVAACMLPAGPHPRLHGLDDSKQLSPDERERLFPEIQRTALASCVVVIAATEIDRLGLHVMNIEGMRRAVAGLAVAPNYVLLDGFRVPGLPVPSLPVIGGDGQAACIAAASVLAKVTRDRIMVDLDAVQPGYAFAAHKGYITPAHSAALRRHGPCNQHRMSYANVAAVTRRLVGVDGPSPQRSAGSVRRAAVGHDGDPRPRRSPGADEEERRSDECGRSREVRERDGALALP